MKPAARQVPTTGRAVRAAQGGSMERLASPGRRMMIAGALGAMLPLDRAHAQSTADASVLHIATVGEPGSLDPMADTSALLAELMQPMFELLYIFTPALQIEPLLASALPEISADGKQYTIPLRTDAHFHDGTMMTADDVVASMKRWIALSPRGRLVAQYVEALTAADPKTVNVTLKQAYAPLLALLAFPNGALVIIPKRLAEQPVPMREFIGTGPWKFLEHVPDQYVRVVKFNQYVSPPGRPNGYGGERHAYIDELRFIPVPNLTTRAYGLTSGEYDFADELTAEAYENLKSVRNVSRGTVSSPNWPIIMFNTKQGTMANKLLRLAAQAAIVPNDMMAATFSDKSLWALNGSIFPKGTDWYIPDTPDYNQHDPDKARGLMKQAGYRGEKVRLLCSPQYDYMIKVGQVAYANLTDVGFNIDLQVIDWATLLQVRQKPDQWEAFVTGEGGEIDPAQVNVFNPDYPGWWDSPDKRAVMNAFLTETDHQKRLAVWKQLHDLFYQEAPSLKVGDFYSPYGVAKKVKGYTPMPWPAFWNVSMMS
jgi:peptide/nickel transport system substrate-binding protein